ncbi:MAG TPA: DUF1501 domain-containing protein [Phycisphaerae bacterium]
MRSPSSSGTWLSDPAHFQSPTRREFLRVGFIGGISLSLGEFFALRAAQAAEGGSGPPAEAVILIFLEGGLSHLDSFDPKPDAAIEIRGDLGTVKTNTGELFGGLFKKTAGVADKLAVVRSFTHGEAAHERGTHNMLTGYKPSTAITYPSMGAVVAHECGARASLPPYICVPAATNEFLGTGYLSSAFGPFSLGADPGSKDFIVRDLSLPAGVDETRWQRRRGLREAIDAHFRRTERGDVLDALDSFYQRAYGMLSSAQARSAFDINAEEAALRDEYGRNAIGQRLLMARRLVEAGVRFVTVLYGGWDHHKKIHDGMRSQAPALDQAYAALIRDLEQRGLLKKTLVVLSTEFGRTTRINRDGGRDHWPKAFSIVFAGGGVQGGRIVGASDPSGAEPAERPVEPADMAATLFTQIGIDPEKKLMSPGNRPIDIVRQGRFVRELV